MTDLAGVRVRDLIELRVAPRAESVATVRLVAAQICSMADFDLDAVSDLRMAVDEACNQIALHADQAGLMRVTFLLDRHGSIHVTVSAPADPGRNTIDTRCFGWHVLRSLTDELSADISCAPGGEEIIVKLAKRGSEECTR